jgi:hypothetical protein
MGVAISTSDMSVTPQADLAKENEQLREGRRGHINRKNLVCGLE